MSVVAESRPRMFSSLTVRNYRLYFTGEAVSVVGNWLQNVALSWLVLVLTGSGTALGALVGARYLPVILFSWWGGKLADRIERRRLLYCLHSASCVLSVGLFAMVYLGQARTWAVFAFALGLGVIDSIAQPARQTIISTLVPASLLQNAIVLNSLTMNIARILGPAIAGFLVASAGVAWCFALDAVTFVAILGSLFLMDGTMFVRDEVFDAADADERGLRYAWENKHVRYALVLIFVLGMFAWEFQVTLPLITKEVFEKGASTYGMMFGFMGLGAVLGGLVIARLKSLRPVALAWAAMVWGATLLVAAWTPTLATTCVALVFVGVGVIAFNSFGKTQLQWGAKPAMRGRVMSLWVIAWQGSTPIGAPFVGWVGETFGARWSLVAGAVPAILAGVLLYRPLARLPRREQHELEGSDLRADTSLPEE